MLGATNAVAAGKVRKEPLPPVRFQGKAFFPIGVYDLAHSKTNPRERLGDLDPALYECGVNTAFFGHLSLPGNKNYPGYTHIAKAFEKARKDPRFANIALIINFEADIFCVYDPTISGKSKRKYRPLNEAERNARKEYLIEAFKYLARQPNVIGYT